MRQGSDVRLDVAQAKRVCEAFSAAMEGEVCLARAFATGRYIFSH